MDHQLLNKSDKEIYKEGKISLSSSFSQFSLSDKRTSTFSLSSVLNNKNWEVVGPELGGL